MALYQGLPANVKLSLEQRAPGVAAALKNNIPVRGARVANELNETLQVLALTIPSYPAAKLLAEVEVRCEDEKMSSTPKLPPSQNLASLVPKLISNNYLASSAIEEFKAHRRQLKVGDHGFSLSLSALEPAYYTIRLLILYNKRGDAHNEQRAMKMLEQLPELHLTTIWELLDFVIDRASDEERERQGAAKPISEWTTEDELIARPATDEWDDAAALVARARRERTYGKGNYAPGRYSIS